MAVGYRGSRKHVLDWTDRSTFLQEFEIFIDLPAVKITDSDLYMPKGLAAPEEARLERFGLTWLEDHSAWPELKSWWLYHHHPLANTPNWDIAIGCSIEDRPGLILVEAKANWPELNTAGKSIRSDASLKSRENHDQIGRAIEQACNGWKKIDARVAISRDSHYQLSNRLAFTWKLATLGIPVVLLYLGFTGDEGVRNVGAPFSDDNDWQRALSGYIDGVFPQDLLGRSLVIDETPVWFLSRSRPVIGISPKP